MPCYNPVLTTFSVGKNGKKKIKFSVTSAEFKASKNRLKVSCKQCSGCLLERSRRWAVRCMHEASLYEDNSFITLTFSPEGLKKKCPTGSLDRKHMQDFMKRLRSRFNDRTIRTYYCGEYGDQLGRPHYHAALFNFDFKDKKYYKTVNGYKYYKSELLQKLWPFGFCVIGELTFKSAAYIARYCLKKVIGKHAEEYYRKILPETGEEVQLLPEFGQASLRPGLGRGWYDKHGLADVYPRDEIVSQGVVCRPPEYYDRLLEADDPALFREVKEKRDVLRLSKENSSLLKKENHYTAHMGRLVRTLESL